MAIKWDEKFEVGHERIDFEHRIFLDLLRAMVELDGSDKDKAVRLLREVGKYADFHFLSEENMMIDVDYPDYESHRQAHQQLISVFETKVADYQNDFVPLSELVNFLFDWFALHTTQVDKKLADFLKQNQG